MQSPGQKGKVGVRTPHVASMAYLNIEYPTESKDHPIAELLFHRIPSVQSRAKYILEVISDMSGTSYNLAGCLA